MDQRFADWYRLVDPDPRAETLQNRWGVIEAQMEKPDGRTVLDLVRLFVGAPQNLVTSANGFIRAFKDADAAFPMRNNDRLVQILAGAALMELLSSHDSVGDVAALALRSVHFQGNGHEGAFSDPLEASDQYLEDRTRAAHRPSDVEPSALAESIGQVSAPKLKALTEISSYHNFQQANASFEAITEYATAMSKTVAGLRAIVESLASQLDEALDQLHRGDTIRIRAYEEEHDVLWWLFAEHSRDLEKPSREVGLPGYAVIAGKELADLTTILPGILSADGMLHRALRATEGSLNQATPLTDAVDATPAEWRRKLVEGGVTSALTDLVPVHLAISSSLDDDPGRWGTRFRSAARLKTDPCLLPVALAEQMYTECILARAVEALGS